MCSFHSFFHLFPASFSLIRHSFSPAVSSDNCDCTCLNSSTPNQNLSFSWKKVHQVWKRRIMHPTVQPCLRLCLLEGCGWHGPTTTIGSMILQPAPQPHPAVTCRLDPRPTYNVWVKKLRVVVWKELALSIQSLLGLRRKISLLLLLQNPQHSSDTPYRQISDHVVCPPITAATRRYTCSRQIW